MTTLQKHGPWALVAGASEGLGAAYAEALAKRGFNLVLLARRGDKLEELARRLRQTYAVEVLCRAVDLADTEKVRQIIAALDDEKIEIGLLVYNACYAPVGPFDTISAENLLRVVDVNVRGPLFLTRLLLPAMIARGRGGVILMSSLAGTQGSAKLVTYAATKAFNAILGEGLWRELRPRGVDVTACVAGAILTPGYAGAQSGKAPGTLQAAQVAERTLNALGRGPVYVPGFVNKIARFLMGRLLPRKAAIALMAGNTKSLS